MESSVRAALSVFGLKELPKTQDELKSIYRKHAKKTHPDVCGQTDTKSFQRVFRANEVLLEAIDEANKPVVLVKFGEGNPQPAKVAKNILDGYEPAKDCKYVVALKWFMDLSLKVADGEWREVPEQENFALDGVWIHFV